MTRVILSAFVGVFIASALWLWIFLFSDRPYWWLVEQHISIEDRRFFEEGRLLPPLLKCDDPNAPNSSTFDRE